MATTKRYDVKDLALTPEGIRRIQWADRQMPVLAAIRERFESEQPLSGYRISACLHVTTETANLMRTLQAGGAELLQLTQLKLLRERFGIELDEVAFAARLRREPELRIALDDWMRSAGPGADWVDWEQRKHERLISAA